MSTLAITLQSRAQDVMESTSDTVLGNLNIFFDYLNSELMLKTIFYELITDLPDPKPLMEKMKETRSILLPLNYKEKIQSCVSILLQMVKNNEPPFNLMMLISTVNNINIMTQEAMKEFFVPVYKYIQERIKNVDSFQYLLIRFKAKSEWFDRSKLFDAYTNETKVGEKTLDSALRKYLFEQGIDFPFSKPSSPSGEVDVLSLIGSKPIPLEIKIFDGEGRAQDHIRHGLRQALCYARDYGEPSAYLVIFNVSQKEIIFNLNQKELPQRIHLGDKTIFIFVVNLFLHKETASKRDMITVLIEETYLLEPSDKSN